MSRLPYALPLVNTSVLDTQELNRRGTQPCFKHGIVEVYGLVSWFARTRDDAGRAFV